MKITIVMGILYFNWINPVKPVNFTDLRRYIMIQPLERIGHIAVLIDPPIILIQVLIHQVSIELRGDLTHFGVLLTGHGTAFSAQQLLDVIAAEKATRKVRESDVLFDRESIRREVR